MALARDVFLGAKFGRLTVLEDRAVGQRYVAVRCDCGTEKQVQYDKLGKQDAVSCGCIKKERWTTHGKWRTAGYHSWASMVQRCTNPNNTAWKYYGGRGITVCERWRQFENFIADMGVPAPGMTIDRIDNEGDYEPSNCRWATMAEQNENKFRGGRYKRKYA